jgi:protein AroM
MGKVAGFMTIGRSPRPDITSDVQVRLREDINILEHGALDRIPDRDLTDLAPLDNDDALIASLGNGREAIVSKAKIAVLLQQDIERLEPEVEAFIILCTGPFPAFESTRKVEQVGSLLFDAVRLGGVPDRLGVMMPIAEQEQLNRLLWADYAGAIYTAVASPYGGLEAVTQASVQLQEAGADLIVMSCMGYSETMRQAVQDAVAVPTIGPGQVLADYLNDEL